MLTTLLPNFVHVLMFVGGVVIVLASLLLANIPFLNKNHIPLNLLGAFLLGLGLYHMGETAQERKAEQQLSSLRIQLAEARIAASQRNVEIVTEVITDTQIIREKGETLIRYVDREIIKYDDRCEVPKEFIDTWNEASK